MNAWIPASTPPPAPGRYWTRTDISRETDRQGVVHIGYTQDWMNWDGQCWQGNPPGYWYGEKPRAKA